MINKRLWKELEEINKCNSKDYIAGPLSVDDLFNWEATILGPENSPYHEGMFTLKIKFSDNYPFQPPIVKFKTLIFHPCINFDGRICLDILLDKWNPTFDISKILINILDLLEKPSVKIPFVPQVAVILSESREKFDKIAKEWTNLYAKAN